MIRLFQVRMSDQAPDGVSKVLKSGFIGEGPKVREFEEHMGNFLQTSHLVTTNSATSAEHLAYHMLKLNGSLEAGDEVLVTPLTCFATIAPILANGLKVKWVDVDPMTMNMDLDDLARKITLKTKAISVVHWGGYPVDMDDVEEICDDLDYMFDNKTPAIIQDCAHALGSTIHGTPLCQWGDYATYSFQAIKHLTCGDGGALVVPSKRWLKQAKLLRWYGIDREGPRTDFRCETDIENYGFKFHMNDISATIGLANLPLLGDTLAKHRANAAFYNKELRDTEGVTLLKTREGFDSAYWIYTIRVEDRDGFMKMMKSNDIEVSRVHNRTDLHSCMKEYRAPLPNLDVVSEDMICIPVGWWLTEEDRQKIVDCIKGGW